MNSSAPNLVLKIKHVLIIGRVSFKKDQWCQIKSYCEKLGLEFLASPFSIEAVELLEEIGVNCYKIDQQSFMIHLFFIKLQKLENQFFYQLD